MWKSFSFNAAALAFILPPQPARAAENLGGFCRLDSLNFVSVTIGNINKAPPITVPVNMTCYVDRDLSRKYVNRGYRIGYCWHVHNTPENFPYRTVGLTSPTAPPYIRYNFYARNGLRVAGAGTINDNQYNILGFATGSYGVYNMTDSMTMRFEGNEGASLKPGIYQFSSSQGFHGAMGAVQPGASPRPEAPWPFCGRYSSPASGNNIAVDPQLYVNPEINVSVKTYCNIRQPPEANFGKYPMLKNVRPIEVPVNVDCSAGTAYRVEVGKGRHAVGDQRYMTLNGGSAPNGEKIAYYVGPVSWGGLGNGTPAGVTEPVTFVVPNQPTPPAGTYKDTLILTLERFASPGDVFAATYDGSDPRVHRLN